MRSWTVILFVFFLITINLNGQVSFDGQVSAITSFSPQEEKPFFVGLRYIPELSYNHQIDTFTAFDFEASANFSAVWNQADLEANVSPYRIWARYTGKKYEIRAGLQKIEFGSAAILRPLQWFNQVDPRDPLQLTNGVYGLLGKYVFSNNVNIWVWGLYGNEKTRGYDLVQTNASIPEYGGRIQFPVPKGEIGLTYHHRVADSRDQDFLPSYEMIPENRVGFDAKWDLGIGLWVEAAHQWKDENLFSFTNQTAGTIGLDYTFGIGNGLALKAEHMFISFDEQAFDFSQPINFTAAILNYPLSFFDNVTAVMYYNWLGENATFLINYEHQFEKWSMYLMLYYNPENTQGIQQNDLVYSFNGPGVRLMTVYSH